MDDTPIRVFVVAADPTAAESVRHALAGQGRFEIRQSSDGGEAAAAEIYRLQRQLRLEKQLGQLRDRLLRIKDPRDLVDVVMEDLPAALQAMGLPVSAVSAQMPCDDADSFMDIRAALKGFAAESERVPMQDYPWVKEVWESQKPVLMRGAEMASVDYGSQEVACLLEAPVPGGGSIGVACGAEDVFDDEAVATVQAFVGLFNIDEYRQRVRQLQRQQAQLMEERVQNAVLRIEAVEDFVEVVGLIADELLGLGVDFDALGLNIPDESSNAMISYNMLPPVRPRRVEMPLDYVTNQELLDHWKAGRVWERVPDGNFAKVTGETETLGEGYRPGVVIDVPFEQGTLVIGLKGSVGYNRALIGLMQELLPHISLGYRRVTDLAARAQAEADALKAKAQAEDANRIKSEFLANMSHELRTPLNAILGINQLLLGTEMPSKQQRYLETMLTAGQSLTALLDDLLDLTKIEAGQLDLEPTPFSPKQLLKEVGATHRVQADDKGLALQTAIDDGVPKLLIADPQRLRQVIVNLVDNAVKFTEEGRVEVRLDGAVSEAGFELEVAVSDTGIGIPEDKQQAIFELFTQGDGSMTREYGGTGLGLAICSRLAAMMGGRIEVESEPGKGSCFRLRVCLPVHGAVPEAVAQPALPSLDVLLVADSVPNRMLWAAQLKGLGQRVWTASGGEAAGAAAERDFDLVLMDVVPQGMDGTAVRQIRAAESGSRVSIVALVDGDAQGDGERLREWGMDQWLAKPLQPEALRGVLAAC